MTTVEKILKLIEENNIEQQKFAADIGLKKQCVSEWKSGKTKSYMKYIDKIAEYFGVSIDYLLGNERKDEQPLDETESKILLLARKTKELPEADRQKLLKIFEKSVDAFLEGIEKND